MFSRLNRKIQSPNLFLILSIVAFFASAYAQSVAPGGPGKDAQWATAAKQGIGTSATLDSKVWFTLADGVMTEVYYPNVTVANVHVLQFLAVDGGGNTETERDDAYHEIKLLRPDSLSFQQINTAKSGKWKITKTYTIDTQRSTVLIDVKVERLFDRLKGNIGFSQLYVYYDPSLANTGMHDNAWTQQGALLSQDGNIASALVIKEYDRQPEDLEHSGFRNTNNGFLGTSGGTDYLKRQAQSFYQHPSRGSDLKDNDRAENGNVTQTGSIFASIEASRVKEKHFTLALSFGQTPDEALQSANASLQKGFAACQAEYEKGWSDYAKTLPRVDLKYQAQFNMAAMVLKAQEDKTVRGANVASLTIPWGGGANANEDVGGGYHLVWARDLYHVFTAYLALGDKPAAERALDFLFNIQQKEDGSFPQNSWLDGKRGWGSLQLDEVGYPLIMAYQLGRFDKKTYENHVKRAADFLVKNGPRTPQERWEEEAGYSPSTIAAEIAGLVCATEIAKRNGDDASSVIYLATADDWARNIERWTATTTGKYGDGNYYLRITQNGNPDSGDKIELNNGAGTFDEREIVDAGFLELVRLGIKPADDPLIAKSDKVIDQQIKVATPNGESFFRYSHDGYGEMDDGRKWNFDGKYTGKGRLWALLAGERGQYEIAECEMRSAELKAKTRPVGSVPSCKSAGARLDAMLAFANDGVMIPEQIWDKVAVPKNYDREWVPDLKFGEGTGSATPLAWSMGQFIRLATNLKAGRNLDTPDIVFNRYAKNGIPTMTSNFGSGDSEVVLPMKPGETMRYPRQAPPGTKLAYQLDGETRLVEADSKGQVVLEFKVPPDNSVGIVGVLAPDGSTAFERVTLRTKPKEQTFSPALVEQVRTAKQSPLIVDGKAIFFYRGAATNGVQLAGDITSWNPNQIFMQKIVDDLWAVQLELPPAARTEYKLIVDGKWILDPADPNSIDNGVGDRNNFFAMPEYRPNETAEGELAKLDEFRIQSKDFGERAIKVWLPDGYESSGQRFPAMYFQDGSEYARRASAAVVARQLIRQGRIKPLILVLIDPKERNKEYSANDQWADFIANELVPEIDKRYRTIADRDARATLGASLGGITSLWIGLKYPEKFARLGGQSSSFWVDDERVVRELSKLDPSKTKFRFYLDDGVFEGTADSRRVNVMLRGKGYPVTYIEGQTGHNWTAWRDRLADAFIALWK